MRNPLMPTLSLLAMALPVVAAESAQPALPAYRVVQRIEVGAPDRWDYLSFDSQSHRVYLAHGDRLTVVDAERGVVIGQVEGFAGGTHGSAVDVVRGRGFTDDGEAGTIGVFDLKSLQVTQRLKGVVDADGIVRDPLTGLIFVVNGDSGSLSVVDAQKPGVSATVQIGGKLEFAVPSGDGKLYVNGASAKELVRIDTRSLAVESRWPLPTCTSPHGIAMDPATHRVFVSCINNLLVVVNAESGAVVASVPIGAGSDALVFDPVRKRVISANGRDGTLSVIEERDADHFVALPDVPTQVSARTLTIDPQSGRLYLAAAQLQPPVPGAPPARPRAVAGSLQIWVLEPTN